MKAFTDQLTALIEDPRCAGIRITTRYTSPIGPTVAPPAGTLRADGRDVQGEFTLADGRQAVTIDSWGSQASRMEIAAEEVAERIGFPLVRFRDEQGELLTTSVRLSHRQADATWRAGQAELTAAGIPFERIRDATAKDAGALLRWFPTAPLFGWWHSHTVKTGKKKDEAQEHMDGWDKSVVEALTGYAQVHADARSARLVTAEIVAADVHRRRRFAAKSDSLFGPLAGGPKGESGRATGPSAVGLGSLPPVSEAKAPVDVTFAEIVGTWFLSFSGLRTFAWGEVDRRVADALTVSLALLLQQTAARHSRLRSGTELVELAGPETLVVRHGGDDTVLSVPPHDELVEVVRSLGAYVGWGGAIDVTFPDSSVLMKIKKNAMKDSNE